jgi:metallophosphoesterase superfamily enzyme
MREQSSLFVSIEQALPFGGQGLPDFTQPNLHTAQLTLSQQSLPDSVVVVGDVAPQQRKHE